MTRTQYYVATSIDGFIADEHNSLGWLFHAESKRNEGQFDSFFSGVGSFAMGATTYEWVLRRHDLLARPERWREWYGDVPVGCSRTVTCHRYRGPVRVLDLLARPLGACHRWRWA